MKSIKNFYRVMIAGGSLLGFMGGWALLAHAPKPVSASAPAAVVQVELAPLPTLEPLNFSSPRRLNQNNIIFSQNTFSRPRFRTGGS